MKRILKMIVHLTPKQHELVKDILEEARAVSQQLIKQVPTSQKSLFVKQAKDIRKVLNKFAKVEDDSSN